MDPSMSPREEEKPGWTRVSRVEEAARALSVKGSEL